VQTGRADEMRGFEISGFGAEDAEHLRRSAEYLGPLVPMVLDALYDHLLSLPQTRGFFETQDIQHRKQSLVSWIARTIEGPHDGQYWDYLVRVGKVHRDYGIPYYQMVHLIGWVQGTIASALLGSDRPEKEAEAGAWIKMRTAQLDPMLLPYQEPVS
jgi:hypothetical protein